MASYTQILYHIVIGTYNYGPVLDPERIADLNRFLIGIFHDKGCCVYNLGGDKEHIHILCDLNPEISLSSLIDNIKDSSTRWIISTNLFPEFSGWQPDYNAFTCSWQKRGQIAHYIETQQHHHEYCTFQEEMEQILTKSGLEYKTGCLI